MAREVKPLILRTVDDDSPPEEVIRLGEAAPKEEPVVLGSQIGELEENPRLEIPSASDLVLRSHEPGIEAIIEQEQVAAEALEQNWGEEQKWRNPVPWGWFALAGLMMAAALGWSLTRLKDGGEKAVQIRKETESSLVDEKKEEREAARLVDQIDKTLRAFFSANSLEGMARLVRQPDRVLPLMKLYYGGKPPVPGRLRSIRTLQPVALGNHGNFWLAVVVIGESKPQHLVLEIGSDGEPRLDWETLVCYQPMNWDDFAHQRPAGRSLDFRVNAEPDTFYSHEFSDAAKWRCYRLTAVDSEETLFGYVKAGSEEEQEILKALGQGDSRKASFILRLMVPEGLQSRRGVVIEKLMSPRWIYLEEPDSGS